MDKRIESIQVEGDLPSDSKIRTSKYWTFKEIPLQYEDYTSSLIQLYIIDDFEGIKHCPVKALKELLRIQNEEENKIELIYGVGDFYDGQCNIEFPLEAIKLLGSLNCVVTISCYKNDEEE